MSNFCERCGGGQVVLGRDVNGVRAPVPCPVCRPPLSDLKNLRVEVVEVHRGPSQ